MTTIPNVCHALSTGHEAKALKKFILSLLDEFHQALKKDLVSEKCVRVEDLKRLRNYKAFMTQNHVQVKQFAEAMLGYRRIVSDLFLVERNIENKLRPFAYLLFKQGHSFGDSCHLLLEFCSDDKLALIAPDREKVALYILKNFAKFFDKKDALQSIFNTLESRRKEWEDAGYTNDCFIGPVEILYKLCRDKLSWWRKF